MNKKPSNPWVYLLGAIVGIALRGVLWVISVYLAIMALQYIGWI